MTAFLIFISLAIFASAGYVVWPSRYNIVTHLSVGANFISTFVPAVILTTQDKYPQRDVDLYVSILTCGVICFVIGLFIGFYIKPLRTKFTYDLFDDNVYNKRVIYITKIMLVIGIVFLIISYAGMGFIPAFAADPIAAKFFRGAYMAPYMRVAILFRSSFYILSTVIPIACIIWYKTKSHSFLLLTLAAITLLALSLARSPAFSGVVLAVAIVMSLKSKFHFKILMVIIIFIYVFSSVFYYLIGAKQLDYSNFGTKHPYWEIVAGGSPDIEDQLQFLGRFQDNPKWTYGRTVYGGLIPGHYEWNPGVYTLNVIAPGLDIDEAPSGGLRLPVAMWGYVCFEWIGVVLFCLISGFFYGYFLRYTKTWMLNNSSILTKTVVIVLFNTLFANLFVFYTLSIYMLPQVFILLFYIYRIRLFSGKPNI